MKLSKLLSDIDLINISLPGKGPERINIKDPLSIPAIAQTEWTDPEISSVHYSSLDVKPGGLFIAIPGYRVDGHSYIENALEKGAKAVVVQKKARFTRADSDHEPVIHTDDTLRRNKFEMGSVPVIEVENSRKALAAVSARFFGNPSAALIVIGITGTNGKTTVSYLVEKMLSRAGLNPGVIGTINYRYSGKIFNNPVTTPESLDLQRILADMHNAGITHVVMEVSSHAIDLDRVHHCDIDIGVFTNLTQDHLDYHGDMNAYWNCKKRLFTEILNSGPKKDRAAVINCNDPRGKELRELFPVKAYTCGYAGDCMIRPESVKQDLAGISGEIRTPAGGFDLDSPLTGKHNLENILCAAGVGAALGLSPYDIGKGIASVTRIPGRLERVPTGTGKFVYVDYAHTPDALKNVLLSLKALTRETTRIICVFGCGGDRDKAKRPLMGEAAGKLCDLAIVTSDNPRTEKPTEIIEQIITGLEKLKLYRYAAGELPTRFSSRGYVVEPDRRAAIKLGIDTARAADTVLIAGKGHEDYQIIGTETIPFDDREVALKALSTRSATA